MYQFQDAVIKKNVSMGVQTGFVIRSWENNGAEYVRVKWDESGFRSTCKASSVLPNTPENQAKIEARYDKQQEKIQQNVSAIMAERTHA